MASTITSFGPCALCNVRPQFRRTSSTGISSRFVRCGVRGTGSIVCSGETEYSGGGHSEPPKLEPFSQGRITRAMRERSFLQKTEDALNERCLALDGEAAYQCWEAVSEYENIREDAEKECNIAESGTKQDCKPLERLENMVRQSGGVNSLIDNVLMVARIKEVQKKKPPPSEEEWLKAVAGSGEEDVTPSDRLEFLEDGGIPKSEKEMQEEKEMLEELRKTMPDSLLTKVLRRRGHRGDE